MMTRSRLTEEQVARESDKQRFVFSDYKSHIRATHGHSFEVDLGLDPERLPDRLFHGTAKRKLSAIREKGLTRQGRRYVHPSPDAKTAHCVGSRHGSPVVLEIDARDLREREIGQLFFVTNSGVWLTSVVPPQFIEFPSDTRSVATAEDEHDPL